MTDSTDRDEPAVAPGLCLNCHKEEVTTREFDDWCDDCFKQEYPDEYRAYVVHEMRGEQW